MLEAGAHVTIISSSQEKVDGAVTHLNNANAQGKVANVRDEAQFTSTLLSLAPLDHIVFSSVDKIIRGPIADADLDDAKHLFGVKFWGSVIVGKGKFRRLWLSLAADPWVDSPRKVRYCSTRRVTHSHIRWRCFPPGQECIHWWWLECRHTHSNQGPRCGARGQADPGQHCCAWPGPDRLISQARQYQRATASIV